MAKYVLKELYGVLMTHELNITKTKTKTQKSKEEAGDEKSKQQIALKSVAKKEEKSEEMNEDEIDDLAGLLGKFGRFSNSERFQRKSDRKISKDQIICHECKKPRPKRSKCPLLKKKFKKKKALQVITV